MTTKSIFWDKTATRDGGGLAQVMHNLTCERVTKLFGHGAGMKMQRQEKYSRSLLIRLKPSNQLFSLYMCYGVWRVGFTNTVSSKLNDLLMYLDPVEFPFGQLTPELIAMSKLNEEVAA